MKNIIVKICLMLLTLFLSLITFEFVLRVGLFNEIDSPHPNFIPYRYKKIDQEINLKNMEFSKGNRFGFNDKERNIQKRDGLYRIAVLGDSCIWGDGLPYNYAWGHKLEKKFAGYSDKIEVMNWGLCGWSTLDEFNFLKRKGIKYDIDLLIISFCANDLDMGDFHSKFFSFYGKKRTAPLLKIFPNVTYFIGEHVDSIVNRFSKDWGYANWVEKLYMDKNLSKYDHLLEMFSDFCRANHINFLFVLVPSSYDSYFEAKFNKVKLLLKKNHINYIDTYPIVVRDLSKYKMRQLWANPANGHPGNLVTEVVADEVFRYFVKSK